MKKHNHVEAFMLMRYESKDGSVVEYLWNSRDGVTPFNITAKDNQTELSHTKWDKDEYRPRHQLMPGDRYFGELTQEKAKEYAIKRVDSMNGTEYEVPESEKEQVIQSVINFFYQSCPVDILTK